MGLSLLLLALAGEFRWQPPEACPDEVAVREQTEAVIGQPAASC